MNRRTPSKAKEVKSIVAKEPQNSNRFNRYAKLERNNFKFLLVGVGAFSKLVYVIPLKNKKGPTVLKEIKELKKRLVKLKHFHVGKVKAFS